MPAALAVPAVLGAVGIGGSIFSGISGAKAASSASQIQSEAAAKAGQQVTDAARNVNPLISGAAGTAGADVTKQAGLAGAGVASATDRANALLDPYRMSGEQANDVLSTGLTAGGQFNRTPSASDIQMDPGFAARLAASQKGLERSAAARGGAASGTALQDLARFNQTEASNEYEKAYQRFAQNREANFNYANTVAGRGNADAQTEGANLIGSGKYSGDATMDAARYQGDKNYGAAVQTGANTINAADRSADYATQGANAQAAGVVGRANAITGAVSSGIGAIGSAGNLYNQLKNPNRPIVGKA